MDLQIFQCDTELVPQCESDRYADVGVLADFLMQSSARPYQHFTLSQVVIPHHTSTELENIISHLHLENWGWCIQDEQVIPVWFTGNQIPPSLRNSRQRKRFKKSDEKDECIADDESSSSEEQPPRKKPRKTEQSQKKQVEKEF